MKRDDVLRACARILRTQIEFAGRARPTPPRSVVAGAEHRALAREVAHRATVLLRNESVDGTPLLPLDEQTLRRVAVLGRLADRPNLGDTGSSNVRPRNTVSVLQGLREQLGSHRVVTTDPGDADVAVVVVGLTPKDEGEALIALGPDTMQLFGGIMRRPRVAKIVSAVFNFSQRWWTFGGDRSDLRLHDEDVALIRAVAATNPRTVVIVIGEAPSSSTRGTATSPHSSWRGTPAWRAVAHLPTSSSEMPSRQGGCPSPSQDSNHNCRKWIGGRAR